MTLPAASNVARSFGDDRATIAAVQERIGHLGRSQEEHTVGLVEHALLHESLADREREATEHAHAELVDVERVILGDGKLYRAAS